MTDPLEPENGGRRAEKPDHVPLRDLFHTGK
jgi:hypothetical protein